VYKFQNFFGTSIFYTVQILFAVKSKMMVGDANCSITRFSLSTSAAGLQNLATFQSSDEINLQQPAIDMGTNNLLHCGTDIPAFMFITDDAFNNFLAGKFLEISKRSRSHNPEEANKWT
jgi:hypothetical protein